MSLPNADYAAKSTVGTSSFDKIDLLVHDIRISLASPGEYVTDDKTRTFASKRIRCVESQTYHESGTSKGVIFESSCRLN
jgi:hypothetical protein